MVKAFDIKDLGLRLKAQGLDVAEDMVRVLVEETLGWVSDSVLLTENKFDDFALAVIPAVKPFIMDQIDRIDGDDD